MPEYSYHAVSRDGTPIHGLMAAETEAKLDARLQEIGYWLIDAKQSAKRGKLGRAKSFAA